MQTRQVTLSASFATDMRAQTGTATLIIVTWME